MEVKVEVGLGVVLWSMKIDKDGGSLVVASVVLGCYVLMDLIAEMRRELNYERVVFPSVSGGGISVKGKLGHSWWFSLGFSSYIVYVCVWCERWGPFDLRNIKEPLIGV